MTGNADAGRGPHPHGPQDAANAAAGDRNLFRQQHPATAPPPSRFSSPCRPRPRNKDSKCLGMAAAASTMVQGVVMVILAGMGVALWTGASSPPTDDNADEAEKRWSWSFTMYSLYFNDEAALPDLPEEGLVSPALMFKFTAAAVLVNFVLVLVSLQFMLSLSCSGSDRRRPMTSAVVWALFLIVATTLDVVVATAMVRDLVLLEGWKDYWPGDFTTLLLCPGVILVVALRGGVLLLANVVCMLLVLRRMRQQTKRAAGDATAAASLPATKTQGPLDGYLYPNGSREGVNNLGFVHDGEQPPWTTFKPEQRSNGHAAAAHDLGYSNQEEAEDLSADLMWMEEVDKHVDVQVRRAVRDDGHHRLGFVEVHGDRPPAHHRYGFVEARGDRPPQYLRYGFVGFGDHRLDQQFPSGRMVRQGGWPPEGLGLQVPRLPPLPVGYKPPALPPVDYSPPTRRRHGEAARAEGRAEGRRPVRRQDRY